MILCRRFEEKIEELFMVEGVLYGPAHLGIGQEATSVGILRALGREDLMLSNHRGHSHAIAKGISLRKIMSEIFGKRDGTCKGLGGSMHAGIDINAGSLYYSGIVGSQIPIAVGIAFAVKRLGESNLVTCFFGDGATTTGAFAEGLNMAAYLEVPLLLVCENNQYSLSFKSENAIYDSIAKRGACYGIKTYSVDGNDVLAVYKAATKASNYIRAKSFPAFIEARTYRIKGHGVYDTAFYRQPAELEEWVLKDPIVIFKEKLLKEDMISNSKIRDLEEQVKEQIEDSVNYAKNSNPLGFDELIDLMGGK
jgi:pyruvate dehydrogenase E1 component alpha subunit